MLLLKSADNVGMRILCLLTILLSFQAYSASGLKGSVQSPKDCSSPVMLWVSLDKDQYKERLLLMHSEVPVGGTFQFYLKPGDYQIRASDEKGCEFMKKVSVASGVSSFNILMDKK